MTISEIQPGQCASIQGVDIYMFQSESGKSYILNLKNNEIGQCKPDWKTKLNGWNCTLIPKEEFNKKLSEIKTDDWFVMMIREGLLTGQL